jgi:hypothetical protein
VQVLADQRKESAVAFLEAAVAHFAKLGVRIERVMTDNGMLPVKKLPSRLQSPPRASSQRAHASAGLVPFTEVNPPQRQLESTIALE